MSDQQSSRHPRVRRLTIAAAALVAAIAGTTAAASGATAPTVTPSALSVIDLGTLRGFCCSQAQAINNNGVVVGQSAVADGENPPYHAFRWQGGHMSDLGTLGGSTSTSNATSINDFGVIAGYSALPGGNTHAVIWVNGHIRDLGTLGGANSVASGINNNGAVVGWSQDSGGGLDGFVWRNGVMSPLAAPAGSTMMATAINNNGQISVTLNDSPGRWFGGSTELCTTEFGHGYGINIHGDVAGHFSNGPGHVQTAFVFHNHTLIPLPMLADSSIATAFGVNASRVAVGMDITTSNVTRPIRWPAFGAASVLPGLSGGTGGTGIASGTNNVGSIVGWSSLSSAGGDYHAVLWTS